MFYGLLQMLKTNALNPPFQNTVHKNGIYYIIKRLQGDKQVNLSLKTLSKDR